MCNNFCAPPTGWNYVEDTEIYVYEPARGDCRRTAYVYFENYLAETERLLAPENYGGIGRD